MSNDDDDDDVAVAVAAQLQSIYLSLKCEGEEKVCCSYILEKTVAESGAALFECMGARVKGGQIGET